MSLYDKYSAWMRGFEPSCTRFESTTRKHAYNEEKLRGNIFLVNLRENYYDFTTKLNFVVKS